MSRNKKVNFKLKRKEKKRKKNQQHKRTKRQTGNAQIHGPLFKKGLPLIVLCHII